MFLLLLVSLTLLPALVVETAPQALALLATAHRLLPMLMLLVNALVSLAGVKLAASASLRLRAVEMLALNSSTEINSQHHVMMLVSSRSMKRIGIATLTILPVMLIPIFLAHGEHTKWEETLGNTGQPAKSVVAVTKLEGFSALF